MTLLRRHGGHVSPEPAELLSIEERARYLAALRICLGGTVLGAAVLAPELAAVSTVWMAMTTAAYLALGLSTVPAARRAKLARPFLQGSLLLDGIYLATIVAVTGGTSSPLRFLPFVHVGAVTLLASYRTGLKLTLWHTLLFVMVVAAIDADLVPVASSPPSAWGATAALTVAGLWLLALGTAAATAASERELRRQKFDLGRLSEAVARIEAAGEADEVPHILLEEIRRTFGFARGVVLGSPGGSLRVLATSDPEPRPAIQSGTDPVMDEAWDRRAPVLVRSLDVSKDQRVAALLPNATNVIIVPLFLEGGQRLGILALELGPGHSGMRRWVVAMVAQFAAHGALALHNAWLRQDRESQLAKIKELDHRLRVHNAELEDKVAERTAELRAAITDLEEIDRQRRRLLDHVVNAAEEERRRIANDIHDDPVQKMVALKMRLEILSKVHPDLTELEEARAGVLTAIRSMRHLLFDLRPPVLDEEGLAAAIRYFLENTESGFAWSIEERLDVEPPSQVRLILYRVAQEALNNVRKHAMATRVRVTLADREDGIWMQIEDDGVGFAPQDARASSPGHLGLAAMRERIEMAAGRCELHSLPGAGTTLEAWLPVSATSERPPGVDGSGGRIAEVLPLRADQIA